MSASETRDPIATHPWRLATESDVPALSRMLARAFDRDPFFNWMVRQDERRVARLEWTFEVMLRRLSVGLREAYTTTELDGVAIWKHSRDFKLPLLQQLQLLPALARAMGWARIPAFFQLLQYMEPLHERLLPQPHVYLFVLGVDPTQQRRGQGTRLLQPVLARCDRDRTRAYLETSLVDNLPFYTRQGFEVVHVVERPTWPTFWMMIREPAAATRAPRE